MRKVARAGRPIPLPVENDGWREVARRMAVALHSSHARGNTLDRALSMETCVSDFCRIGQAIIGGTYDCDGPFHRQSKFASAYGVGAVCGTCHKSWVYIEADW